MTNKPYHHLDNGKFRNPEGSPIRSENVKWSYSTFNKEKKKLDMTVPDEHVIKKNLVLEKTGSVIIVVLPNFIKKVACPIQPI